MNKLKILDLFSGIGGFSLGLERTGNFETAAFCEIDKAAQKVLKKHWPTVPIFEDVSTLTAKDLNGTIDVICGGFPCQDISLAGKGAGLEGARSGLWFEFHRLIQEIKPKFVIIENVSALRSRGLDQVLRGLSEIGYDAEWHCIPASAVGAKHKRDRIWVIAYPSEQRCDKRGCDWKERHLLHNQYWNASKGEPEWDRRECGTCKTRETDARRLLADTNIIRAQVSLEGEHPSQQVLRGSSEAWRASVGEFWSTEPGVGRVADGVPKRVDRLKQLGNAVVPQIPELIGRSLINS